MSGAAAAERAAVLLDTCALIWFLAGTMPPAVAARVIRAGRADGIFISPVSTWEIGLLAQPRGNRVLRFLPDPKTWFQQAMASAGFRAAPFTLDIASTPATSRARCTPIRPTGCSSRPRGT